MKEIENADNGDFAFHFKIFESIAEFIPQPVIWELEAFPSNNGNDDDYDEMTQLKRKEVNHALADTTALRGRRIIETDTFHLDNMLKGYKTKIKEQIKKFRKTYSHTTHLAFLLMILVKSGCVDKLLPYPHFHHAMEEFEGKKYDMDRGSRMYTYMFYNEEEF